MVLGQTAAGHDVDRQSHAIDVLPTACAAGVEEPVHLPLDGWDFWPLLTDSCHGEWTPRQLMYQWHRGKCTTADAMLQPMIGEVIQPHGAEYGAWELYGLLADPGETTDVAAQHPESSLVCRMRTTPGSMM